ncbi:helix-turn-helix transcriptional regulator [Plantibacter sp. RU18]|uniref:helix-turn-helix transcriptional regulator n=1 Tax=Plantibacter sp. RU18 TaxID=3158143 RepID=UPI003D3624CF
MFADLADAALVAHRADVETATRFFRDRVTDLSRSPSGRVMLAHSSRIIGTNAATALGWVDDLRGSLLTPLPAALLTLMEAESTGDATAAERAGRALEQIGARHRAVAAYRLAEDLHQAANRPSHARWCAERAASLVTDAPLSEIDRIVTGPSGPVVPSIPSLAVMSPDASLTATVELSGLTKRELEITHLVAQGLSNQEIAIRLFLSVRTVESHVLQARTKLGAARRRDLGRMVVSRPEEARPPIGGYQ